MLPQGIPDASNDSPSGWSFTLPVIYHFNPNRTSSQDIKRIRVYDSTGALIFDTGLLAAGVYTVPPLGSFPITVTSDTAIQGLQFIVNWSQATDAAAPISRADLFHIDQLSAEVFSVAQTTCP
jgi:hypothetical protein